MRGSTRLLLGLFVIFMCQVLVTPSGHGQSSNGAIAGSVVDKSGAAVPNAIVEATSTDRGGAARVTETDSVGSYRIEALLPGTYSVVIKKGGFSELKISGIDVKASLTSTANATLEVAGQTATVLVEASTGQELQTQSGELSANITPQEIKSLPIFGLNPISLVLTQPGVQDGNGKSFSNGVGFSVNGARPRGNNFLIDGQDNNDNSIQGQAFQPSNLEAIGEVTILTNSYSPEFGRGGGSVTNVIYKGGTNVFHGSAWELANNSALASVPAENKIADSTATNPVNIDNTFGFAIGGPIKHDKLFVFGSSQWDRFRATNNGSTIMAPTATGYSQLQALGTNANAAFLIAAFGGLTGSTTSSILPKDIKLGSATPTGPDRGVVQFGPVQRSGIGEASNDRQWNVRVDFNATEKDTLTARYYRDDSALTPDLFNFPRSLPPFDSLQGGPSQSIAAMWTHTISNRVVNEFRTSYTNIGFVFGPTPATAANPLAQLPTLSIAGISASGAPFPSLGFPSNLPQGRAHKSYQYQDALSYSVGHHQFKGGIDVNHLSVVDAIPFNSRGTIGFTASSVAGSCGAIACTGLANFIDNFSGPSGTISKVFGSPILQPFVTTYAPYIVDTWRLRENFTLDLGMRYEYLGTPENVLQFPALDTTIGIGLTGATFPSAYSKPQIPDRNNFAPRIGFAYTPHFGHRLFGQNKTVIRAGYGMFYDSLFTNILDNTGGTSPNAVGGTITGVGDRGTANATGQLNAVAPLLNPFATVNSISSNLVNPLTHQWNFNIQRELPGSFIISAAYVGSRGEHLYVNQQFNPGINNVRVNPAFGNITVRTNGGDSVYHAGQFSVDRKFSRGLLLRAAYTYSKLIDDSSEVFTSTGASSFSQDAFNQKGDRGPSAYDRRQRFVLSYVWDIPYVHRSGVGYAVLRALTSHWQWSGIATFQSGIPDTIFTGLDRNRDLNAGNDRPDVVDPTKGVLDPARYAASALGTKGNLGRNTYFGPNEQFWDMSITRTIPIWERHALAFRAEFYNALNHPNLGVPSLNFNAGLDPDLSGTTHGQRQIKIYLKYSF